MQLSQEALDEFKQLYKKHFNKEIDNATALDKGIRLINFVRVVLESDAEDRARKHRLKKEPKGFPFPSGKQYGCPICGQVMMGEQSWYDKCSLKCLDCQKALDDKIVPSFIFIKVGILFGT